MFETCGSLRHSVNQNIPVASWQRQSHDDDTDGGGGDAAAIHVFESCDDI